MSLFYRLLACFCLLGIICTLRAGAQGAAAAPAWPLYGRSVQIDPGLPYYRGRSPESIASELRAHGYRVVRYVVTESGSVNSALLRAFHREGMGVWFLTFANGTYSTRELPSGWEEWRMVTRATLEGKAPDASYTYLCLNNPAYRAWKKRQIAATLKAHLFQGVDIAEPHWPEYPGVTSLAYGCFCKHCLAAFRRRFPEESHLPDILHPDSPYSPANNPALWRKWLAFRVDSLTDFLNDLFNGSGGIRSQAPGVKVCIWTLALTERDGLRRIREDNGEDAGAIARVVGPDMHCFQTHWPDWIRADLKPDYVEGYRPFITQIRRANPRLPLMIQADIGSQPQNRRSWDWIRAFERHCARLGVTSTTLYEYSLGKYINTQPPRGAWFRCRRNAIALRRNYGASLEARTGFSCRSVGASRSKSARSSLCEYIARWPSWVRGHCSCGRSQ